MKRKFWTIKEVKTLELYYEEFGASGLLEHLPGRSLAAIQHRASMEGLKYEGTHKGLKNLIPGNPDLVELGKATRFKPGSFPKNTTRPAGRPYKRTDKGRTYWMIRPEGQRHVMRLHHYLWEKANGGIPDGKILVFKNGDSLDCRLENIICIDRAEHARRCVKLRTRTKNQISGRKAWRTRDEKMRERLGLEGGVNDELRAW